MSSRLQAGADALDVAQEQNSALRLRIREQARQLAAAGQKNDELARQLREAKTSAEVGLEAVSHKLLIARSLLAAHVKSPFWRMTRPLRLLSEATPFVLRSWVEWQGRIVVAALSGRLRTEISLQRAVRGIRASGRFAMDWYRGTYPDVAVSGIDPVEHYVRYGAAEGRDPDPLFDSDWYLRQYPDVAATGMNPFFHYLRHGAAEGREPGSITGEIWLSGAFNEGWYGARGLEPAERFRLPPPVNSAVKKRSDQQYAGETRAILERFYAETAPPESPPLWQRFGPVEEFEAHLSSVEERAVNRDSSARPSFSVVTTFFRHLNFLPDCAKSVAAAVCSYESDGAQACEWLVVNDDPAVLGETLRSFLPGELSTRAVIRSDGRNGGITPRLNEAITHARNEWVVFLDCDDMLTPDALQVLAHYIRRFPKCRYISSAMIDTDSSGETLRCRRHVGPPSRLVSSGMIAGHLKAIRRDAFDDYGLLDPSTNLCQDYEFALRFSCNEPILVIPEYLYRYRWHPGTQSVSNIEHQNAIRDKIIRRYLRRYLAEKSSPVSRAGAPAGWSERRRPLSHGVCVIRTQGKRLDLLAEAIRSVQGQRMAISPVVVVHGTAEAFALVSRWCATLPASIVCLSAPDLGKRRGYPLNVALDWLSEQGGRYDFLCFLDDDDIYYPSFSSLMTDALLFTDADIAYCASNRRVPWDAAADGYWPLPAACLVAANFITFNGFVVRLDTVFRSRARFDETLEYLEDWGFLLGLLRTGARFEAVFEHLVEFRIFGDGNVVDRRHPELFAEARRKLREAGEEVAVGLTLDDFHRSVVDFDFSRRPALNPTEIDTLLNAKSIFRVASARMEIR